jgi:hypothetical protein
VTASVIALLWLSAWLSISFLEVWLGPTGQARRGEILNGAGYAPQNALAAQLLESCNRPHIRSMRARDATETVSSVVVRDRRIGSTPAPPNNNSARTPAPSPTRALLHLPLALLACCRLRMASAGGSAVLSLPLPSAKTPLARNISNNNNNNQGLLLPVAVTTKLLLPATGHRCRNFLTPLYTPLFDEYATAQSAQPVAAVTAATGSVLATSAGEPSATVLADSNVSGSVHRRRTEERSAPRFGGVGSGGSSSRHEGRRWCGRAFSLSCRWQRCRVAVCACYRGPWVLTTRHDLSYALPADDLLHRVLTACWGRAAIHQYGQPCVLLTRRKHTTLSLQSLAL